MLFFSENFAYVLNEWSLMRLMPSFREGEPMLLRYVSFSENFAYVLNEWTLMRLMPSFRRGEPILLDVMLHLSGT